MSLCDPPRGRWSLFCQVIIKSVTLSLSNLSPLILFPLLRYPPPPFHTMCTRIYMCIILSFSIFSRKYRDSYMHHYKWYILIVKNIETFFLFLKRLVLAQIVQKKTYLMKGSVSVCWCLERVVLERPKTLNMSSRS